METIKITKLVADPECMFCEGMGRSYVANGTDDYEVEVCQCLHEETEGEKKAREWFAKGMQQSPAGNFPAGYKEDEI